MTTGGPVKTRTYDVTDFTAVQVISSQKGTQVYHTFEVQIVPAEAYSVSVAANENLFPYIHVTRVWLDTPDRARDVQVSFAPTTLRGQGHYAAALARSARPALPM